MRRTIDADHKSVYRFVVLFLRFVLVELKEAGDNTLSRVLCDLDRISVASRQQRKALNIQLTHRSRRRACNDGNGRRFILFAVAHSDENKPRSFYFSFANEPDQRSLAVVTFELSSF